MGPPKTGACPDNINKNENEKVPFCLIMWSLPLCCALEVFGASFVSSGATRRGVGGRARQCLFARKESGDGVRLSGRREEGRDRDGPYRRVAGGASLGPGERPGKADRRSGGGH